ncbi:MAG: helix-turn-helix domain-containing protein [Helicobacteraceae bacterium]|nr:helix-turn-helix domain-containing protein [Helicobacteraceae bacterium]
MKRVEEVLERIREIIASEANGKRVKDADIARELGVSAGALATLKNRDRLPIEEIAAFCAKRRVSINWVLFNQSAASLVENTEKYSFARYFSEARLSAGGGAFDLGEEYETTALSPCFTDALNGSKNAIDIVKVEGDSMETTIKNGDLIFVDRDETRIKDGAIYAIAAPLGLFVKRLRRAANGSLTLASDNAAYPDIEVSPNETRLIGRVIGVFSVDLR